MGESFREVIAERATNDVLRANPFRVLGRPTDATNEVLRHEMVLKRHMRRLADSDPLDAARFERVFERLSDPRQRLVDELLWLWPDDVEAATGHNAAIEKLRSFVEDEPEHVVELCGDALAAMATSLEAPATADYLTARCAVLRDPRLSTDDGRELAEAAQLLVPVLALRIAEQARRDGRANMATQLAELVGSRVDPAVAAEAVVRVGLDENQTTPRQTSETATAPRGLSDILPADLLSKVLAEASESARQSLASPRRPTTTAPPPSTSATDKTTPTDVVSCLPALVFFLTLIATPVLFVAGWLLGWEDKNEIRAYESPPVTVTIVGDECELSVQNQEQTGDARCDGVWTGHDGDEHRGTVYFEEDEPLPTAEGDEVSARVSNNRAYVGDPPSDAVKESVRLGKTLRRWSRFGLITCAISLVIFYVVQGTGRGLGHAAKRVRTRR